MLNLSKKQYRILLITIPSALLLYYFRYFFFRPIARVHIAAIADKASTKIFEAAEKGDLATVKSFLCSESCGPTEQLAIQPPGEATETMPGLIETTLAGEANTVKVLLEQGVDPNLVYNTNTALTYAARDGFIDIARLLVDHGADVNWIDGERVTPLILASFKDHIEIVKLLLAHGADVTVRDQWDRTALDYALRRGENDEIAQLLQSAN